MTKSEIKENIQRIDKKWYYYYNFDGIEVHKKAKDVKTRGLHNWSKLKETLIPVFETVGKPYVFDVGCNMGLLSHEMAKLGAKVLATDVDIEQALFFKRYISENTNEKWNIDLRQIDIINDRVTNENVNIITMFGVLYWFMPHASEVVQNFQIDFPNHRFIVLQGNLQADKKKDRPLSKLPGMVKFLKEHNYTICNQYNWDNYQKPVVVGERMLFS